MSDPVRGHLPQHMIDAMQPALRLSPTEQIEAHRARRWLKKAERDVADRIRRLSTPVRLKGHTVGDLEDASTEFLKGVQLLAKARWLRDQLKASVL